MSKPTAHSRGPINDRAAGLLEAAQICKQWADGRVPDKGGWALLNCADAITARAATVEQVPQMEGETWEAVAQVHKPGAVYWLVPVTSVPVGARLYAHLPSHDSEECGNCLQYKADHQLRCPSPYTTAWHPSVKKGPK